MINSIDRDGKKEGYDLDLLKIAKENLDIPLIPLGGVGNWNHFSEAFDKLNEILNVAETAVMERERPEKVKPPVVDDELDTDYQYARENYYNVIV